MRIGAAADRLVGAALGLPYESYDRYAPCEPYEPYEPYEAVPEEGWEKDMMSKARIGAAVVGGYVLGRRKKAKLALGLGLLLIGAGARRQAFARALSETPIIGTVNERLRGELSGAGKAAATAVLTASADRLADAVHDRTVDLLHEDREDEEPQEPEQTEAKKQTEVKKLTSTATNRARKTTGPRQKAASAAGTRKRSADHG
jgi:hypothetical protein